MVAPVCASFHPTTSHRARDARICAASVCTEVERPSPALAGLTLPFPDRTPNTIHDKKALIFSQHLKKGNDFTVLVEMQNGPATLENSWTISLKYKQTLPLQFSNCIISCLS